MVRFEWRAIEWNDRIDIIIGVEVLRASRRTRLNENNDDE